MVRSRRNRKPSSKYDPAVYDLDSVQLRGIPLSGKKNGWRGVLARMKSPYMRGEEELQESSFILYIFQIVVWH